MGRDCTLADSPPTHTQGLGQWRRLSGAARPNCFSSHLPLGLCTARPYAWNLSLFSHLNFWVPFKSARSPSLTRSLPWTSPLLCPLASVFPLYSTIMSSFKYRICLSSSSTVSLGGWDCVRPAHHYILSPWGTHNRYSNTRRMNIWVPTANAATANLWPLDPSRETQGCRSLSCQGFPPIISHIVIMGGTKKVAQVYFFLSLPTPFLK